MLNYPLLPTRRWNKKGLGTFRMSPLDETGLQPRTHPFPVCLRFGFLVATGGFGRAQSSQS